jgi:uncharacterized protein
MPNGEVGFVEDYWLGCTLCIWDEVALEIMKRVARCVMTTLPQAGLSKDPVIMRTAYRHIGNSGGAYAGVLEGGRVGGGDRVVLD